MASATLGGRWLLLLLLLKRSIVPAEMIRRSISVLMQLYLARLKTHAAYALGSIPDDC